MPQDDANDYVAFHAVLTHNGFTAAARRLGVPKGTLSKRIARLEDRLGVRLIERSTRSLRATDLGLEILEHARLIVAGMDAAAAAAAGAHAEPNGLVRVGAPHGLMHGLLTEVLPAFLRSYPRIRLQLEEMNRPADLVQDRIDLALRARLHVEADASLIVRRLGRERALLVASPVYLAGLGAPPLLGDLGRLPVLAMPSDLNCVLVNCAGESASVDLSPRLTSGNMEFLRVAAEAGLGIALLPEHICRTGLEDRRLERVLPEWSTADGTIYAVFSSRRGVTPALRALIDYLAYVVPSRTTPL